MSTRQLEQMRARLISLREQRNRMVHRSADLERQAAARVQAARTELERVRAELAVAAESASVLRPEVEAFERGRPPADDESVWRSAWSATAQLLDNAEKARAALEDRARELERVLQLALAEQEAASADQSMALARLEQEIGKLTGEVSRLQAETPPVEAPNPRFREVLMERLHHLEAERSWISEEIAQREERLRRIGAEAAQVRGLLDLHTPEWGREALESLSPDGPLERMPAWKQGVLEILGTARQPLHYREIAEQLAAIGRSLGGQDPAETLLAALGRDQDFVRVGRGTYWLRSKPLDHNFSRRLRKARDVIDGVDAGLDDAAPV